MSQASAICYSCGRTFLFEPNHSSVGVRFGSYNNKIYSVYCTFCGKLNDVPSN